MVLGIPVEDLGFLEILEMVVLQVDRSMVNQDCVETAEKKKDKGWKAESMGVKELTLNHVEMHFLLVGMMVHAAQV